jgi:hypothetical protein
MTIAATAAVLLTMALVPALASAATISGTVSEADGSHAVLEGVRVCPQVEPYTFETSCTSTDSGGRYVLQVPSGTYTIDFDDSARNRNLVDQFSAAALTSRARP